MQYSLFQIVIKQIKSKKIIVPFIFLSHAFSFIHAQDSIIFKAQFKPDMVYRTQSEMEVHSTITTSGQDPMDLNWKSTTESITTTGKLKEDSLFSLNTIFKTTTNDNRNENNAGETIYFGHCFLGNAPVFDSIISSKDLDDYHKLEMLEYVRNYYSQISTSEKKLKAGDEYSEETPFIIAFSDSTLQMNSNTTYHLSAIEGDLATFDFSEAHHIHSLEHSDSTVASGSGKGQFQYDINTNFIMRYEIETIAEMNAQIMNITINTKSKGSIISVTTIEKSK